MIIQLLNTVLQANLNEYYNLISFSPNNIPYLLSGKRRYHLDTGLSSFKGDDLILAPKLELQKSPQGMTLKVWFINHTAITTSKWCIHRYYRNEIFLVV